MKNRDTFSSYHPIISMLYFAQVIVYSMLFLHPVCLCISFLCAFSYAVSLNGKKQLRFGLVFMLPMLILAALFNPAFSHQGVTILTYLPSGNPLTLESIVYGLAAALMMITVISWFSCYNAVMTSDKFVYLFGRIIPALSLVLSMALRFVPRFQAQIKVVANAQRCIGRDASQGGVLKRARNGIKILSIMVTWALENAIETADSMKGRGYGLPGRTAFSIFRFDRRDRTALLFLAACGGYIIVGAVLGGLKFLYYPAIWTEWTPYSFSLFAAYGALCAMPLILNRREGDQMEQKQTGAGLKIDGFCFSYPQSEASVLSDISLTVNPGEFVVLCGPSGCGKTTLLRQCKPALASHGTKSGTILLDGCPLEELSAHDAASKIGFVQQSPENQIVTDKVWHELAFGLESLGFDTPTIRLRVAEMASFFGIQEWFYRSVTELSGGQKQLLALASVMAMQPSLLILDEPTSQLDPIAAAEFLATVGKINRELGVTVLLTEHRLEEAFPLCSRAVVMDNGRILCDGTPSQVGAALRKTGHGMFAAMPAPMRIWAEVENSAPCPVTVQEGRQWISGLKIKHPLPKQAAPPAHEAPSVELEEVWFKYNQDSPDVVKGLNFCAYPGEITAILGGNGTGKTTSLSLLSGLNRPYRGKVKIYGEDVKTIPNGKLFNHLLGVLPQNPQALFTAKTVEQDLMEILSESGLSKEERKKRADQMARLCGLSDLLKSHPYDLSGGEQQRAALAKVLLLKPKILLLDEPTKGLDAEFKQVFAGILHQLAAAGVTIVMVSHDIEFCAEHTDRCALFFDGGIVTEGTPRSFFSGNSFYTSAANRMARHVLPEAVTAGDVIAALGGAIPDKPESRQDKDGDNGTLYSLSDEPPAPSSGVKPVSLPRKITAGASVLAFLATLILLMMNLNGFMSFISGGSDAVNTANDPAAVWRYVGIMLGFALEIVAFIGALTYKRESRDRAVQMEKGRRRLSKRTIAAAAVILIAIPVTIYIGIFFLDDRKYYFISLLIILETMLPFALVFEGRKPQARELIILAVLTALAVAGRAAFFMLPQFKPVAAMVIIAGVAFGGEAGFLVGALSAFVSNMLFGQGPWTPWQMFAFGMIGFLAGVLFKKGVLLGSRGALCAFGGLATFVIYGGLMNSSSVLMTQSHPTKAMFLAAYLQGIPFDLVHALATVVFLACISQPMLDKLDRIKVKYGLLER